MEIPRNSGLCETTGWEAIEGLSLYSDLRYRGGAGVNKWVGASSQFAPSTFQGGRLWRFQQVYLTYITPELFGIKEFLHSLRRLAESDRYLHQSAV